MIPGGTDLHPARAALLAAFQTCRKYLSIERPFLRNYLCKAAFDLGAP
jgi:hypothetical protein